MSERLLDIIVPRYREPWKIVKPFFDMLNSQQGVDFSRFRVILVNDGSDPLDFFGKIDVQEYRYEILNTWIPHKGVSAARNYGLEKADAKYVCFCDCDDCFSSIYALREVFYVMDHTDAYDLLWGPFYTNMLDIEDRLRIVSEFNGVWIHCKFYRLSFLREKNLKFCEELYMSEDSAFNNVLMLEIGEGKIGEIHSAFPLYSWNRRVGSVTTDPAKILTNVRGHFFRNKYVLEEYRKRNAPNANVIVVRAVTDVYSMVTKYKKDKQIIEIDRMVAGFYRENEEEYNSVPEELVRKALAASDREAGLEEKKPERPTLDEWIDEILKENETEDIS